MDIYGWINGGRMNPLERLAVSQRLLKAIAEIDEFKGRWAALG